MVKRCLAYLIELLQSLLLFESLEVKFEFLHPEIGLDLVCNRLEADSSVKPTLWYLNIPENHVQISPIFRVEDLLFVNEKTTAYRISFVVAIVKGLPTGP